MVVLKLLFPPLSDAAPTDALVFTPKLTSAEARRIITKLFPEGAGRARSFLYAAMEVEGFERARPNEYKPLLRLLRAPEVTAALEPPGRKSRPP